MIDIHDLSVRYPEQGRPILDHVSLDVPEGNLALVVGRTGSGKSTLLGTVNGLVPRFTGGHLSGRISVHGRDTAHHQPRDLAELVGYVGQDPLAGFVTDVVEEEIAYGMEQLGVPASVMRKRVAETLDLMGIGELRRRSVRTLSGGQQQRVAIASVLAVQPRVLVLDEPTSALDPVAASDVLSAISTLVLDAGLTVLLAEHRLERVMKQADEVIWLPGDGAAVAGPAAHVLLACDVPPPLAQLARALGWPAVPLSVRQARRWLGADGRTVGVDARQPRTPGGVQVRTRGLSVRYGPIQAVHEVDLELHAGQVTALMGRNGAGKSSLLWALQGGQASTGQLSVCGCDPRRLGPREARRLVTLVPQTPADLLYLPTVAQELAQADVDAQVEPGTAAALLERLQTGVDRLADPHDLSEGQRLALVLAIQLAAHPRVVLLDEPTRGLDYQVKHELAGMLGELADQGLTVLVSTHDVEFVALAADRTIVMADADIIADGPTREVVTSSLAYAPQVARAFAPLPVLTLGDLADLAPGPTPAPAQTSPLVRLGGQSR